MTAIDSPSRAARVQARTPRAATRAAAGTAPRAASAQPARIRPTRDSEITRAAILRAASREFAQEGIAGARTDAIARTAKVNKALLYYYFQDKETLYGAALEQVFAGLFGRVLEILGRGLPPKQTVLEYAGTYFDYIASNPDYPRLVHQEMTRAGRGGSPHLKRIADRFMLPVFGKLARVFEEGKRRGEFRDVAVEQFVPSMIAVIVFYFVGAPMIRLISHSDPLSPERIAARRAAVLDFIAAALFRPGQEDAR